MQHTCPACTQVAFRSPEDALAWCMATQRKLLACPWPPALLEHAPADCGVVLAPPGPPLKPRDLLPTYKRLQVRGRLLGAVMLRRHTSANTLLPLGQQAPPTQQQAPPTTWRCPACHPPC